MDCMFVYCGIADIYCGHICWDQLHCAHIRTTHPVTIECRVRLNNYYKVRCHVRAGRWTDARGCGAAICQQLRPWRWSNPRRHYDWNIYYRIGQLEIMFYRIRFRNTKSVECTVSTRLKYFFIELSNLKLFIEYDVVSEWVCQSESVNCVGSM